MGKDRSAVEKVNIYSRQDGKTERANQHVSPGTGQQRLSLERIRGGGLDWTEWKAGRGSGVRWDFAGCDATWGGMPPCGSCQPELASVGKVGLYVLVLVSKLWRQ